MDISLSSILSWFKTTFLGVLEWIKGCFVWIFDYIFNLIVTGLEAMIDYIGSCCSVPVSSFISYYGQLQSHSSGIAYVTGTLNLTYGVTVMAGALVLRFIIRRIPLIG